MVQNKLKMIYALMALTCSSELMSSDSGSQLSKNALKKARQAANVAASNSSLAMPSTLGTTTNNNNNSLGMSSLSADPDRDLSSPELVSLSRDVSLIQADVAALKVELAKPAAVVDFAPIITELQRLKAELALLTEKLKSTPSALAIDSLFTELAEQEKRLVENANQISSLQLEANDAFNQRTLSAIKDMHETLSQGTDRGAATVEAFNKELQEQKQLNNRNWKIAGIFGTLFGIKIFNKELYPVRSFIAKQATSVVTGIWSGTTGFRQGSMNVAGKAAGVIGSRATAIGSGSTTLVQATGNAVSYVPGSTLVASRLAQYPNITRGVGLFSGIGLFGYAVNKARGKSDVFMQQLKIGATTPAGITGLTLAAVSATDFLDNKDIRNTVLVGGAGFLAAKGAQNLFHKVQDWRASRAAEQSTKTDATQDVIPTSPSVDASGSEDNQ